MTLEDKKTPRVKMTEFEEHICQMMRNWLARPSSTYEGRPDEPRIRIQVRRDLAAKIRGNPEQLLELYRIKRDYE